MKSVLSLRAPIVFYSCSSFSSPALSISHCTHLANLRGTDIAPWWGGRGGGRVLHKMKGMKEEEKVRIRKKL